MSEETPPKNIIDSRTLKSALLNNEPVDTSLVGGPDYFKGGNSSFENTGFNVIDLIKSHLSHSEPAMFYVIQYYVRFRRTGHINRLLFWFVSYVGQLIDMLFSFLWTLLKAAVLIGIIIAVLRGLGLDTFIIDFIKALKSL